MPDMFVISWSVLKTVEMVSSLVAAVLVLIFLKYPPESIRDCDLAQS